MSPELRTPLNAIIGFAVLPLMRDVEEMAAEQRRGSITNMRNSGAHLIDLIDDIRDDSKLEAGPLQLNVTRFDLCAFVYTCARSCMTRCGWCARRRRRAVSRSDVGRGGGRRALPADTCCGITADRLERAAGCGPNSIPRPSRPGGLGQSAAVST